MSSSDDLQLLERVLKLRRSFSAMQVEFQEYKSRFEAKVEICDLENMTIEDGNEEEKSREEYGEKSVSEQMKDLGKWHLKLKESERNITKEKEILKSREVKANDKEALVSDNVLNLKKAWNTIEAMQSTLKNHQNELDVCVRSVSHKEKAPQEKMKDAKNKENILLEMDDNINTIREFLSRDVGHMFSCLGVSCSFSNCKQLKELEACHGRNSECHDRPVCRYCRNYESVLMMHAASCQVPGCRVPTCRDLHGQGR